MGGWTKQHLVLLFLAGCFYPEDVRLVVPEAANARAIAFATRDPLGETRLEAFDLTGAIVRSERLGGDRSLEVAALLYAGTLAELGVPPGVIEVPDAPPENGRPLPFERGFSTAIAAGEQAAPWIALQALPEWLEHVRLPGGDECDPPTSEATAFAGLGDRVRAAASDGRELLVATHPSGAGMARYFAVTSTAIEELPRPIPNLFRPRAAAAHRDGSFVVAGVVLRARTIELWKGGRAGFTRLTQLDRFSTEIEIEVDGDRVYLMTELGEVLLFDGASWTTLRAPFLTAALDDDRFGLAWVAPGVVLSFGPYAMANGRERFLERFEDGASTMIDLGEPFVAYSISYHPELGTVVGTTTGDVLALAGDRFELIASNRIFSRAILSSAPFRGDLATGGTNGAFAYRRKSAMPCFLIVAGGSLTTLFSLEDQLVSVNRSVDVDAQLVRIR